MMKQRGFTLIELVLFIIIIGVIGTGLMLALNTSMSSNVDVMTNSQAINLAQSRMEIILGQKRIVGFSSFTDICDVGTPPAVCPSTTGFTVTTSIANNWNSNTNYKVVTVTVTGSGRAKLTALVGNY